MQDNYALVEGYDSKTKQRTVFLHVNKWWGFIVASVDQKTWETHGPIHGVAKQK